MTINTDLSRLWYKVLFGSKTDVITEFPYIFNTMQTKLSDWDLFGNVEVSGTPTPDNPIMPQGTGERTGNLVHFYQEEMQGKFYGVDITVKNAEITLNGTVSSGSGYWVEIGYKFGGGTESTDNVVIPCEPETSYTITTEILDGNSSEVRIISFGASDKNKNINIGSSLTTMFSADINRIFISLGAGGVVFNNLKFRVMFNKGSTPLPYEPYGYKIPISSAGQTTPVYLGEVETTRKIKKVVFTGSADETWNGDSLDNKMRYYPTPMITNGVPLTEAISTHFAFGGFNANSGANGTITGTNSSSAYRMYFWSSDYATVDAWKSYLAQQYANGTPVTVWYVLANEETAVVNEPLMKIGNYADSMSRTQTGIDIQTVVGQNTLNVLTTVKPSSMRIEYTSADETRSRSKRISLLKRPLAKV